MRISIYNVQDEPIGCGGMGNVYLGSDAHGNKVAIKEMRAELVPDASLRMRFQEEIRLMSKFEHPFIVKMYASFVENENMYLVMEYIDGITLEKHVRLKGRLTEEESVAILIKVLDALQYAHKEGVVHRDIKPSNIMIREDGRICLLDFGIAKDLNRKGLTVGELSIGTSGYMSPEQAEGLTINHLSDIYSLGCVLYYMLTGQHAVVKQSNDHATRMTIIMNEFPKANLVNPNLSDFILSVLDKATNKNMMKRFQSCNEFEMRLTRISGTVPYDSESGNVISIGRGDCDIKIYDPYKKVSSHHADIEYEFLSEGYQYVYIDRSTNGTLINGEKVYHQRKVVFCHLQVSGHRSSPPPSPPIVLLACSHEYQLNWTDVEHAFERKGKNLHEPRVIEQDLQPRFPEKLKTVNESLSIGWILLSLLFPIVGWVMYYQWKEKSYRRAKKICILSWFSFAAGLIINLISMLL